MFTKIAIAVLLAAVTAHAASYGAYYKPKQQAPAQHAIDYKVKWEVKDEPSYNYQTRDESKYADKVEGSYSLVDADGTLRIVTYTADENGFVAHVENKPLTFDAPKYEAYSKYEAPQQAPSQYQQAAPQQSAYQQSSQSGYGSFQASEPAGHPDATFGRCVGTQYPLVRTPQSHYQQAAPPQFHYQLSSQSNYGSFQVAEPAGVTIFSAPPAPAPAKPNDQVTLFSAPAKPTFSQSSEVSFRPVVRPTMNTFQQPSNYNQQSDSGSKYH